jgi:hypothetical protein
MTNFYGGSTIIKGGKFASHDPADDSFSYAARNKSPHAQSERKSSRPSTKKTDKSPQKMLQGARRALLHIIIDQILKGQEEIKVPKTIHPEILEALGAAGTPITWAKNQKEFETLQAKKLKKHTERELKRKKRENNTSPFEVDVKRKKQLKLKPTAPPSPKFEPTPDERYQANRMALMRNLVDQMIKKPASLSVPEVNINLLAEIKASGSALLWLQAQPEYKSVFKARYPSKKKATGPLAKKTKKSSRKKNRTKQKVMSEGVSPQGKATPRKPTKKKKKQYYDPYETPARPVTPLSDAPVSYIRKQINKLSDDTLDHQKINWYQT